MSHVPTIAIDLVDMHINSTVLHDEVKGFCLSYHALFFSQRRTLDVFFLRSTSPTDWGCYRSTARRCAIHCARAAALAANNPTCVKTAAAA